MSPVSPGLPDVYTPHEVARAAGVSVAAVEAAIANGGAHTIRGDYLSKAEAVWVAWALKAGIPLVPSSVGTGSSKRGRLQHDPLFTSHQTRPRAAGVPALASTSLHVLAVAALTWISSLGIGRTEARTPDPRLDTPRLVFLNMAGPGGGGGGGGLRQATPVPKVRRQGHSRINSPLPKRKPPPVAPPEPLEPPPLIEPEPLPPVIAPVATRAADPETVPGDMPEARSVAVSRGAGDDGGIGQGRGTGVGPGRGSGVGQGSGGGTGGGPYRAGAGIRPPTLLREIKAEYSEDARRNGVRGEVLLEVVVRTDGSVGGVRVLRGLGHGLDERAVEAVQQWRFSPARRFDQPVDVVVEVAVQFKLR